MAGLSAHSSPGELSRLFLALWPDSGMRAALQTWRDGWQWSSRAQPVRADSLHLTLHFLGNVPNARLPALAQGLQVAFQPFELQFSQAMLWPHGIAVLQPDLVPEPLLHLHAALDAALKRLELPTEARPYRPHVTLARRADGTSPPEQGLPVQWTVRGYALMESRLGSQGEYTVLQRYVA